MTPGGPPYGSLAAPLPPGVREALQPAPQVTLVDVLDRLLDKGVVIAGRIDIALADVPLVSIRLGLTVCSIDKAAEVGLDWWARESAPFSPFSSAAPALPSGGASVRVRRRRKRLPGTPGTTG